MLEVLIDNKNGTVWDLSDINAGLTWKTSRIGKASSVEITLVDGGIYQARDFAINNGDILRVRYNGSNVFYGYVFSVAGGKSETVKITAYDQVRYLMSNDTYVFAGKTATQVISKIASDFGLKVGTLADTGYKLKLIEDNQKLLDIICKALDMTLINTGKNFVFYDDFGQLALRNTNDMALDFVIGDDSLMYDYDFTRSIDNDTYNRIKLVRDNKKSGKRDVYVAQDSTNIAKWGRLQYYQTVDEDMNASQINELLKTLIAVKNREQKSLKIKAIGDIRARAGCYVPIIIDKLGIRQHFLVDECTHDIDGFDHTMTLDLKVI